MSNHIVWKKRPQMYGPLVLVGVVGTVSCFSIVHSLVTGGPQLRVFLMEEVTKPISGTEEGLKDKAETILADWVEKMGLTFVNPFAAKFRC